MNYPSKNVEKAVEELSKLPGIGKRTALRLALHLLKKEEQTTNALGESLINMRNNIIYCSKCHNISDQNICEICADKSRDQHLICVVEDIRDVMAIENTGQYRGLYHILGGIISPIEGIGPEDLTLKSLFNRIAENKPEEIIIALPTTIEGDTTAYYIHKNSKNSGISISTISRGISVGNALEYTDEITLGRSILNRIPFQY